MDSEDRERERERERQRERGINPIAITIINHREEYWPSLGSNQQPHISSPVSYRPSYAEYPAQDDMI